MALAIALFLVLIGVYYAGLWSVFEKAGRPGWHSLIPILGTLTLLRVAGKSGWWLLGFLIPFFGLAFYAIAMADLGKRFGKNGLFSILLILFPLVTIPVLGFGSAKFLGDNIDKGEEDAESVPYKSEGYLDYYIVPGDGEENEDDTAWDPLDDRLRS